MNSEIRQKVLSLISDGVLLSSDVTTAGIHRSVISELVAEGTLIQSSRGVYMLADEFEDEYLILQKRYARGIYSHATALYLHGYSDRVPLSLHMTFPIGYNSRTLKSENVKVTRVSKTNYDLGISTIMSPYGNEIKVYDLERSLCDVLRGQGDDIQIVQAAFKKYAVSKDKDVNRLVAYSKQLLVEPKVRTYMEVLL
ncbi:MAG: type IV toxin-antitoxin system AbiEi family antitoxin domain-containing protein [Lachnospiraceae bacterium]|nr:type IV toxin-antitoxin system AbiEi family antitoxin domain-containing protein [Lachnospiraceae bacterium]